MTETVGGVFVGGASTRMLHHPKGLLPSPTGEALVTRCCAVLRAAGIANVVLVGTHPAYASVRRAAGLDAIADEPPGIGPLGGLIALLKYAGRVECATGARAIAIACDMPFVSEALVSRLLLAPDAPAVAPRRADRWEPLCARYDARALPVAEGHAASGDYSLQGLLASVGAIALDLPRGAERELVDWDTPEDVRTHR